VFRNGQAAKAPPMNLNLPDIPSNSVPRCVI
jgi:hypothetical protein